MLLAGVNDEPAALEALMRAFVETRIKPYYLHHADLARGTSHLRTSLSEGQSLMRQLRGRVSGLCQPTYVLDVPGGHGKVPVGACYLRNDQVEDPFGGRHVYGDVRSVAGGTRSTGKARLRGSSPSRPGPNRLTEPLCGRRSGVCRKA